VSVQACRGESFAPEVDRFARHTDRTRDLSLSHAVHQQKSGLHPPLLQAVALQVVLNPQLARPRSGPPVGRNPALEVIDGSPRRSTSQKYRITSLLDTTVSHRYCVRVRIGRCTDGPPYQQRLGSDRLCDDVRPISDETTRLRLDRRDWARSAGTPNTRLRDVGVVFCGAACGYRTLRAEKATIRPNRSMASRFAINLYGVNAVSS